MQEDAQRYHRLRASIPANLWRRRAICGWRWHGSPEHINSLELRAVWTALKVGCGQNFCIWSIRKYAFMLWLAAVPAAANCGELSSR